MHAYLKRRVIQEKIGILLYKPVPAPIDKIKNKYRWRMIIKCIYNESMNQLLQDMQEEVLIQTKEEMRLSIDINPTNML